MQATRKSTKVVLARGRLPCEVLFVGEAPGASENFLGRPFVGPAGKLLDHIIEKSKKISEVDYTYAMTNIIACIPKDEENKKLIEPPNFAIKACMKRLREIIDIANPPVIIAVGKIATTQMPLHATEGMRFARIIHPAAILRMDISQKGLALQRAIVTLSNVIIEYANPT